MVTHEPAYAPIDRSGRKKDSYLVAPITTSSIEEDPFRDDDRWRICKYHDEHPTKKRTEIGGLLSA